MNQTKTASRYAKSMLDLALDKNILDKVNADMKLVAEVCEQNHEFIILLNSPIVKSDKKISIFNSIFKGKITEESLSFLSLIAKKRRESQIPGIASEFTRLYNEHKGIQKAIVITANGIDDELRKKVYAIIKKSNASEIELEEKTNKDLIGGFILKIGDQQIDSSIVRSIKKLKQNFSNNPYVPEL